MEQDLTPGKMTAGPEALIALCQTLMKAQVFFIIFPK